MSNPLKSIISQLFHKTHESVLKLVDELSDKQLAWRPTPMAHCIGFSLLYLARLTDRLQESINTIPGLSQRLGPGGQLWETEGLSDKWGFDPTELDFEETGIEMDQEAVIRLCLSLPKKEELIFYVRNAFKRVEEVIDLIDDQEFKEQHDGMITASTKNIGQSMLIHLTHANRYLGQIECLLRAQGLNGEKVEM